MTALAVFGFVVLVSALAFYAAVAVRVALMMLDCYRCEPWWDNVLAGVLWPVLLVVMLWHLDRGTF